MQPEVNNNPGVSEMTHDDSLDYDDVIEAVEFISGLIGEERKPEIGIICGSGLGIIGEEIELPVTIKYDVIPHFKKIGSGVKGHVGELVIGKLSNKMVMAMKGRFHPYEGYKPTKVAFPIRVMKLIGCKGVIITNAAGGLNQKFQIGDFMMINDHLYLPGFSGFNPLVGPNENKFGTRFPPMGDAYSKSWRKKLRQAAKTVKETRLRKGVYCCVFGPNFETPAEARFLRSIGGDAVGMSSVHEVVAARHCNMSVLAVSMITNVVLDQISNSSDESSDESSVQPNHAEVLETSQSRGSDFVKLIKEVITLL
jgi:purine-nucleoside phosphorylase